MIDHVGSSQHRRVAGAKGLVVDPDAGSIDVALLVGLPCSQKS